MPPINLLIKPASGNCNLRCSYCFYYDTMSKREVPSYGFMSEKTLESALKNVLSYAEGYCGIAFQGGEPTLMGISFYEWVIELQKKYNLNNVKIYNSLQTNGYDLNSEWADFFASNDFLVGVSLDGTAKIHNKYRKTAGGNDSFYRIMQRIDYLKQANVAFNILSVVNGTSAKAIERNYKFFRKYKLDYLQFIPCLDPFEESPGQREYSLKPETYGEFLVRLFALWYDDLLSAEQPFIRQFENYVAMLLGNMPESCDMSGICSKQYVLEADGSVYPCDFYVTQDYCLGNLTTDSIEVVDKKRDQLQFIQDSAAHSEKCMHCNYYFLCRGGYRRTRNSNSEQYFCQSYRIFFEQCLPALEDIAKQIKYRQS